ncbi:MAG: hypothetical protein OWR62_07175 [Sulfobacillus thermotolerans]|uniref:Uncharacterized protein n=1 Tax=Sulfobacillus thermotolerans TaxID=338644 RepID=A0ABM6RQ01_9FIRM|nr:hypothetical protein BXT84_05640 [Sulfobacillus thermotolerans]MCY0908149.1 hypothetical protein [Sulfobacillus thermotolerans]
MQWTRRKWTTTSAAVLVGMIVLSWWFLGRPTEPTGFSSVPTMVTNPVSNIMVMGAHDQPLTTRRWVPALVIVPSRLPAWAQRELSSRYTIKGKRLAQVLWDGHSHFFQEALHWDINGLYPTKLQVVMARHGIPQTFTARVAGQAWHNDVVAWNGNGFASPKRTIWTTVNPSFINQVASALPGGGSVVAVTGDGGLLGQVGSPAGRAISWQPHPVGQALTPLMMALALMNPHVIKGLSISLPEQVLPSLAQHWGNKGIAHGLKILGWDDQGTLPGQLLPNPPLPHMTSAVMTTGRDLWGTPDEVAHAYLPFITSGRLVPLHWNVEKATAIRGPKIVTPQILEEINRAIPTEVVGGIVFHVWRPDANFAIAYTTYHQGMVLVLEGPATAQTLTLVDRAGAWLGQG